MDLATVFPPFGLRVTSGDLELRLPDDAELGRLGDVVVAGIHPPERSPFLFPWNVGEPEQVRRGLLQYHWSSRGKVSPEAWALELAVFRDAEPIGIQSVGAKAFGVTRSAGTGSWLGLVHHGQGIGKRMRLMALPGRGGHGEPIPDDAQRLGRASGSASPRRHVAGRRPGPGDAGDGRCLLRPIGCVAGPSVASAPAMTAGVACGSAASSLRP